jgi:Na+-driven multidrug efflux pump
MTIEASADARPPVTPVNSLLTSPILPTLLKLALPNAIAMFGTALVAVAETSYIGRLGVEPLAGIALVFPFVMLTQMMSAGAMGGGVSSAVSRASAPATASAPPTSRCMPRSSAPAPDCSSPR